MLLTDNLSIVPSIGVTKLGIKNGVTGEMTGMELTRKRCVPCEGGIPPLDDAAEERYRKETPAWELLRQGLHRIRREYRFTDFREAMAFVNKVAEIAEEEGHHPDIFISYSAVRLELFTHAVNGLTENDFIVAAKIDHLAGS